MANLKSSKKDVRRIAKRTAANRSMRTSLKTYVKKAREAVTAGEATAIDATTVLAQKNLDKAVKRGVIHKNQAARRKSRLMAAAHKAKTAEPVAVEAAPAPKAKAAKANATPKKK
jgi:small subunit ribosomal protein S20